MSKKYKNSAQYSYSMDDITGLVTKLENTTGETWTWKAKARPEGPKCNPSNGVTIAKLQEAGHSVRVRHFRWAYYAPLLDNVKRLRKSKQVYLDAPHAICVPSTFRQDPMYSFSPKGGYTHIVIKPKSSDKYICLSSECAKSDTFCYATGVEKALERLTSFEMGYLGLAFHE
jgi:hypothetical protein